ncbi:MAG: hypothetical protein RRZ64_08530 [Rikenellaceae bacterium]
MVKEEIKNNIKSAFNNVRGDTYDADISLDTLSDILADAVIDAIKSMKITYTTGLSAPPTGGPVTGVFNYTIK